MIQFIFIVVQSIILRWAASAGWQNRSRTAALTLVPGSNMYFLRVLLLITGGESSFESRLPALAAASF
jgi:hypothetical protein